MTYWSKFFLDKNVETVFFNSSPCMMPIIFAIYRFFIV
jgi:hypothetical protein